MIEDHDLVCTGHGGFAITVDGIRSERRTGRGVHIRQLLQFIDDEFSTKAQAHMCCSREVDEQAWLTRGIIRFKGEI